MFDMFPVSKRKEVSLDALSNYWRQLGKQWDTMDKALDDFLNFKGYSILPDITEGNQVYGFYKKKLPGGDVVYYRDAPGVAKEDLTITSSPKSIVIKAKSKYEYQDHDPIDVTWAVFEDFSGASEVSAKLKNGVLYIVVGFKEKQEEVKTIEVTD